MITSICTIGTSHSARCVGPVQSEAEQKKMLLKSGTGGLTMATVKCALGKRGRPPHEWNDGEKDRIYCLGWVDPMTDAPLPECLACPDFVDNAQDDLDVFYGRADNDTN